MMPCSVNYNFHSILYPEYWTSDSLIRVSHSLQVDNITITGTKVKLMVANSIILSVIYPEDTTNPLICSSLYMDACEENSKF